MRALILSAVLCAVVANAEPPSTEQMAKIQHDITAATDEVDKKYAGKDSAEDRKAAAKEKAAAEAAVLDKAGVDKKDFARSSAKMSKDDRAALNAEKEKLDKKEKAGGAAAPTGGGEGKGKEIVVEKGGPGGQPMSDEDEAKAADKASGYGKSSGGKKKK